MKLLRPSKWFRSSNGYDERHNFTGGPGPLFLPQYPSLDAGTASVAIGERSESSDEQNPRWIITVKEKINGATSQAQRSGNTKCPSIFRVPRHVRHDGGDGSADKAYGPMTVPIGPYHQKVNSKNDDSHYLAIQNYKWQALQAIFSRHTDKTYANKLQDACLQWLLNPDVQSTVKGYYSEEIKLEAPELAQILLLDASFIIRLLLLQQDKNINAATSTRNEMTTEKNEMTARNGGDHGEIIQGPLLEGTWTWNFIVYDLLKLENQIPFFVIQTLYDKLKIESDTDKLLDLVLDLFSHIRPKRAAGFKIYDHKNPNLYHLLNLFHSSLVYEMKNQPRGNRNRAPERIPNATELKKRALIRIKKKTATEASSFLDVTYANHSIKIPKIQVYDYTESLFRNLIAYEQCFLAIRPQDAYITLYAVLMDCIIDTPKDARNLIKEGILVSRLSSNKATSKLFNKLCKDIHYNIQGSYLEDLFVNVNEDYKSSFRQCLASLVMYVFPNRWAVCSVVAGFILLFLTILRVGYSLREFYHPHK